MWPRCWRRLARACGWTRPPPIAPRDGRTLLLASLSAEPQSVQLDTAVLLAPYAVSTHG